MRLGAYNVYSLRIWLSEKFMVLIKYPNGIVIDMKSTSISGRVRKSGIKFFWYVPDQRLPEIVEIPNHLVYAISS